MPGERMSDYFRNDSNRRQTAPNVAREIQRRFTRAPGGTSSRLGGRMGGFNTGPNQGPRGSNVSENRANRMKGQMAKRGFTNSLNRIMQRSPMRASRMRRRLNR